MKKGMIKSASLGLGAVACLLGILFAAAHMPVMEVVRSNIENRIDSDAYFYTEIEGFQEYEKAVNRNRGHNTYSIGNTGTQYRLREK